MDKNKIEKLGEPFKEQDLEWRCGATTADKSKCLALVYVTNRAIQKRLDDVCGAENWQSSFRKHGDKGVICNISIKIDNEWVAKEDGAEETDIESVKGGLSDAMKRAAVQWGIGRYLYEAEATWEAAKQVGRSTVLVHRPKLKMKANSTPPVEISLDDVMKRLGAATSVDELTATYKSLSPQMRQDAEVIAKCKEVKEGINEIINQ